MRPDQVLYHFKLYGDAYHPPPAYRGLSHEQLKALADEYPVPRLYLAPGDDLGRHDLTATIAASAAARPPSKDLTPQEPPTPETPTATPPTAPPPNTTSFAEAVPGEPETLFDRAIRRQARLSTPARRRAAFLRHFSRCRTVVEAAARTGIDGRTVRRWRRDVPAFAARCEEITASRRREAIESVVMAADQVEAQPVYYRGAKVGEYTRRDRTLGLHLLKQADAEALRAEQRREAAAFEARVQAEVEQRISIMAASGGQSGAQSPGVSSSPAKGLAPAKRTSPSRASVPDNVRTSDAAAPGKELVASAPRHPEHREGLMGHPSKDRLWSASVPAADRMRRGLGTSGV